MIIFIERLLLLCIGPYMAYLISNGTVRVECQPDVTAAFNFTGSIFLTTLSIIVASRYKGIPGQEGLIAKLKGLLVKDAVIPVLPAQQNSTDPGVEITAQTKPE